MSNQKGLTLIEVLGSVVLLGIAVLSITYVLQQSSMYTKQNESLDLSVVISRNVLEQIKEELSTGIDATEIYGQSLSLVDLRNDQMDKLTKTIYYPSKPNSESKSDYPYKIEITSSNADLGSVNQVQLDNYFRKITISTTERATNKKFDITAYVEFNY